jgi:hypothetical protein
MHLKIDKAGMLYIKRANAYVAAMCQHSYRTTCSHHCVKFGTPVENKNLLPPTVKGLLALCNDDTLFYEELIDER